MSLSPFITDKDTWHGYIDFYEQHFVGRSFKNIAEFGIHRGASARWLLGRFPSSEIYGCDILAKQPEWPEDSRYHIVQLDQGNRQQVKNFVNLANFDLIIEDGSHNPLHQINCLLEGILALAEKGIYIVEDIHTSLNQSTGNALSVLLAIDHYRRLNQTITLDKANKIADHALMSAQDVLLLDKNIHTMTLYRRSKLPDSCYNCGSKEYSYYNYRCTCGVNIFELSDSMSFLLQKH